VKFLLLLTLPFLLLSCANLAADRWDEKEEEAEVEAQSDEPEAPDPAPELPQDSPDDDLKLADPVTTSDLMKDENKKTVSGPAPVNVPAPESDSAIEVKPTIPSPPEED
jgi:hypothetical protein